MKKSPTTYGSFRRLGAMNLWAFTPFIVIGIAVIPNTLKIVMAQSTPAHSVESRPWEASRSFDQQREAMTRFSELGLQLIPEEGADGSLLLRLQAPENFDYGRLGEGALHCYRPDRPELDRVLVVRAGQSVVDVSELPRGAWVLTFSGRLDEADLRHTLRVDRRVEPQMEPGSS